MLQANEYTKEFSGSGSVKYYDSNQLASNNPIEDTRSEAQCLLTKGTRAKLQTFLIEIIGFRGRR